VGIAAVDVIFRCTSTLAIIVEASNTPDESPFAKDEAARKTRLLLRLLERSPDGFVVCDPEGHILSANRAFLDFVQVAHEELALGRSLDEWLARRDTDLQNLVDALKGHGAVHLLAATLRGELGATSAVEVSGVSLADADPPCIGLVIRRFERHLPGATQAPHDFPRSARHLIERVGQAPLREIVRDVTDLTERICIESALRVAHDNRAWAAEILGLSRQGLYAKLHRYGLSYADGAAARDREIAV